MAVCCVVLALVAERRDCGCFGVGIGVSLSCIDGQFSVSSFCFPMSLPVSFPVSLSGGIEGSCCGGVLMLLRVHVAARSVVWRDFRGGVGGYEGACA